VTEQATTQLLTFRDRLRQLSPPWLQRGVAEKILYAIGVHVDGLADALVAGVKLRFPGVYSNESLPMLGRERRITRGRNELDSSYAERLARFLSDHQIRGGPYALLSQLHTYFKPDNFEIDLVYVAGPVRFHMDVDGTVTREIVGWTPDADTARWARWWLFYYTDQWAVTPPTPVELQDLKLIPRQWNAAHPLGYIVLFPSDAEFWNFPIGRTWNESGVWNTSGSANTIEIDT